MTGDEAARDFFISYNTADATWAEWIAWTLEHHGYTTIIQAWDFPAGTNFVLKMQEAATRARSVIMVLSPDYLNSSFAQSEWAAMFAKDPQGWERKLIPVMVRECDPQGMLATIVHIRLMGIDDAKAAERVLLQGIGSDRMKPSMAPPFPGARTSDPSVVRREARDYPSSSPELQDSSSPFGTVDDAGPLPWVSTSGISVRRRSLLIGNSGLSHSVLEAHLVPTRSAVLEMRAMAALEEQLIRLGQASDLFALGQAVDPNRNANVVWATTSNPRQSDFRGIAVTRGGQRSAWISLPSDMLGAIFDPKDVYQRLNMLLGIVVDIPIPEGELAPAAVIDPASVLSEGSASSVGSRSRAAIKYMDGPIVADVEGALSLPVIRRRKQDVAEELTARLYALFRDRW